MNVLSNAAPNQHGFESTASTGIIHGRKIESTDDLLPRRMFSCLRHRPHDEVSVDLPALRKHLRCIDFCCNPLSVRYAWRPIIRPWPAVFTLFFFALLTYGFALTLLIYYNQTIECVVKYPSVVYDETSPEAQERILMDRVNYPWVDIGDVDFSNTNDIHRTDVITISPSSCGKNYKQFNESDGDLVMYYQIEPFYQNHRLYIFSRSNQQLYGTYQTPHESESCSPMTTLSDAKSFYGYTPLWWAPPPDNLADDEEVTLHPCGLQAISVFNDTFTPRNYNDEDLDFDTNPVVITLSDDLEIFKNPITSLPTNDSGQVTSYPWMNPDIFPNAVEEPQFINWMRLGTRNTIRKLVGKFEDPQLEFPLKIEVKNRYSVNAWRGEKSIVIAKLPHLASVTSNSATPFWLLASATLFLVLMFFAKLRIRPRLIGDIRLLHERRRLLRNDG